MKSTKFTFFPVAFSLFISEGQVALAGSGWMIVDVSPLPPLAPVDPRWE